MLRLSLPPDNRGDSCRELTCQVLPKAFGKVFVDLRKSIHSDGDGIWL